jgi:hypothetical protein
VGGSFCARSVGAGGGEMCGRSVMLQLQTRSYGIYLRNDVGENQWIMVLKSWDG